MNSIRRSNNDSTSCSKALWVRERTLAIATQFQQRPTSILWVLKNPEQAAYYLNDLEVLLRQTDVLFFSSQLPPSLHL